MKTRKITLLFFLLLSFSTTQSQQVYDTFSMGLKPGSNQNAAPVFEQILNQIKSECNDTDPITLRLSPGKYHFYEEGAISKEYYISNHDQTQPKKVGIAIEGFKNLTIDGQGSDFFFHGRMLPISLISSENCTLKNFNIDFPKPHILQVEIIENSNEKGITFKTAPWVDYRITNDSIFEGYGDGWTCRPMVGIAFEKETKRLVYNTSDISGPGKGLYEISPQIIQAPNWKNERLIPGTIVALRTYFRPAPGIFMSHNTNTDLLNINVHYAEGMGLLAQMCENINLDGFNVSLRGEDDQRYFTTQADATHFSSCKGKINSVNGLYEGMMDDAINVHGTYLKVMKRIDNHTLIARYMHDQAWGFDWGYEGNDVQFVLSETMEITGKPNKIVSIRPSDKETVNGAREFEIKFKNALETNINGEIKCGIENLTWTPEVYFASNIIRNNRARGTLFSTPKKTVVENNLFDHTSGTAILLCGDCNGWFETGACRNVVIRNNHFVNALTNMFQFTNAVISIYPEIPNLDGQKKYFHGGKHNSIIIENNEFETFDEPLLYAKSVDGLIFRNNIIKRNHDYPAFHWNQSPFLFERAKNVIIKNNFIDENSQLIPLKFKIEKSQ